MTASRRYLRTTAATLGGLALLSACGTPGAGTAQEETAPISVAIGEPMAPLVPGSTVEEYGTQVLEALWTGLVEYDADGAVSYTGVAESVESDDSTTWTVRLHDGWTFHDGTPVTARSFVDAWNWTAYSPNAQTASYFFANVEGYGDLQAPVGSPASSTGACRSP